LKLRLLTPAGKVGSNEHGPGMRQPPEIRSSTAARSNIFLAGLRPEGLL
jgi:hypothetical protein